MEFCDVIEKRRTAREFLDKEVDFDVIKRILEAGNKAPTWNHNRNWSYIILRTNEEKEFAFDYANEAMERPQEESGGAFVQVVCVRVFQRKGVHTYLECVWRDQVRYL